MKLSDPTIIVAIITIVGALVVAIFNAPTIHHHFENQQPTIAALNPDKPSPQPAFSVIEWNVTASDQDRDKIYYDFLLKGPTTDGKLRDMTGWTSSSNWTWETSDNDSGENIIIAKANDLSHLNSNYSDQKEKEMIIKIQPYSREKNTQCDDLLDQGRYQHAMDCYNNSIDINPHDADVWRHQGETLYNLGRVSAAITRYDKALEIDNNSKDSAETWDDKGISLASMGDDTHAVDCYKRAININSSISYYWYNMYLSLDALGHHEEAQDAYNESNRLGYKELF